MTDPSHDRVGELEQAVADLTDLADAVERLEESLGRVEAEVSHALGLIADDHRQANQVRQAINAAGALLASVRRDVGE